VTPELAQSLGASGAAGAVVGQVYPQSPAADAGLQQGDLILRFNGTTLEDYHHLQRLVAEAEVGKSVTLYLMRKKRPMDVMVKITESPGDSQRKVQQ
jgi:serine protease Do